MDTVHARNSGKEKDASTIMEAVILDVQLVLDHSLLIVLIVSPMLIKQQTQMNVSAMRIGLEAAVSIGATPVLTSVIYVLVLKPPIAYVVNQEHTATSLVSASARVNGQVLLAPSSINYVIIAAAMMVVMDQKTLTVLNVPITQNATVLVHVSVMVFGLALDAHSGLDNVLRTALDVQVP